MILSVHSYELAETATDTEFFEAVRKAEKRDLFELPGLTRYRFLRGIKGDRQKGYAALWEYESREAWRNLWGPVSDPVPKEEYPPKWRTWEDELLAPIISKDPDQIEYTTYEVLGETE